MLYAPALIHRAVAAPMQEPTMQPGFDRFMRSLMPAFYDLQEDDASWTLSIDVPGIARDQLRVNVIGTTITVDTVEGAPRQLSAAYELPHEIDVDKCEARLENGVLTLKLAKVESAKPRQITVS
jgi:HSP20 family molecular chaperone IbpA